MNRIELIQEIFRRTKFKNYLEIGCRTGTSFLPVKAKYKIAIDPVFKISRKLKAKWILKYPNNINNKYFEEESDNFFKNRKKYLKKTGLLDVVLIDGLHTFKASLSDVLHSLEYLNKNGIIVMHDCYPPHRLAALPLKENLSLEEMKKIKGWTGEWNGDVWKTIVYLRNKLNELLDVCVINTDYGLGIIQLKNTIDKKNLIIDELTFSEIDNLTYEDLKLDDKSMLNLKNSDYVYTIINKIADQSVSK